jgi:hypothetical protein
MELRFIEFYILALDEKGGYIGCCGLLLAERFCLAFAREKTSLVTFDHNKVFFGRSEYEKLLYRAVNASTGCKLDARFGINFQD